MLRYVVLCYVKLRLVVCCDMMCHVVLRHHMVSYVCHGRLCYVTSAVYVSCVCTLVWPFRTLRKDVGCGAATPLGRVFNIT